VINSCRQPCLPTDDELNESKSLFVKGICCVTKISLIFLLLIEVNKMAIYRKVKKR